MTDKRDDVEVIQITAVPGSEGISCLGLGSDGMVYTWDYANHIWRLWA